MNKLTQPLELNVILYKMLLLIKYFKDSNNNSNDYHILNNG